MKTDEKNPVFDIRDTLEKYACIYRNTTLKLFQYCQETDIYERLDEYLRPVKNITDFKTSGQKYSNVYKDDWKYLTDFLTSREGGTIEVRCINKDGNASLLTVRGFIAQDKNTGYHYFIGSSRDITREKLQEEFLEERAQKDPLTGVYNRFFGKELIDEYLASRNPYAGCGMMVLDVDYFKNVNDTYGHMFGDEVLKRFAELFVALFDINDVIMRLGGDEFVILLKDISHAAIMKKAGKLIREVQKLKFPGTTYLATCSVGICFLPENVSGYTYQQLFENADLALYQAKKNGKNRYAFCDNLRRFEDKTEEKQELYEGVEIDARYLHNDIVSTAFEIFEKMSSFQAAIELLMKVIGLKFRLNRITVLHTKVAEQKINRVFQWVSEEEYRLLIDEIHFSKSDFITLFRHNDEYGTVVIQENDLAEYSEQGRKNVLQCGAKTVVCAAMYCEGSYTGAIAYVTCQEKRLWSREDRKLLGEVTKIISAHYAKNQAFNSAYRSIAVESGRDQLTGLSSFSRFRENVEKMLIGGYGPGHAVIYTDFEKFKRINAKYGYRVGDQILRQFSEYVISVLKTDMDVYFTRAISDHFILFTPCDMDVDPETSVLKTNQEFLRQMKEKYPDMELCVRTGIYLITKECNNASEAIDAANYARKYAAGNCETGVKLYDEELKKQSDAE